MTEQGCRATFETVPPNRRHETHTCARLAEHTGPHVCPVCQRQWIQTPSGNEVLGG